MQLINSFILFINNFFNIKIYGNITIYHILAFLLIISGSFTLIKKLLEGRK